MSSATDKQKRDDFWDLDKLVPKRASSSPFATRSVMSEHLIPSESNEDNAYGEKRLTVTDDVNRSASWEYYPSHSLIRRVKIKRRVDKYDFYDNFRKAAIVNFDCRGDRCEFVQYYSYMPQYSQLTPAQKSYYFYWRGEVRRGSYIKTDYSYLYLYVYEIINLPDLIPPTDGLAILIRLWREYRHALPRIDLYFSIWVRDYCLVHNLELPMSELSDFIFDIISASSFKEYYLSYYSSAGELGILSMLAYLSDYDYRRGKFIDGNPNAEGERRERQKVMYRAHMQGAMSEVLKTVGGIFDNSTALADTAVLRVDAFPNSLCTHSVKCMLEIEYYPIAEAKELRQGITAAVRYAENRLRALMGVKSRLAVVGLPEKYREVLDGYFDALERRERTARERELEPEYERQYYAPSEILSSKSADEIEAISWDTTARLVTDTEEETVSESVPTAFPGSSESTDGGDTYGLDAECVGLIEKILCNTAPSDIDVGAVVDKINGAFADGFGDVIIELREDGYAIIEDYREDVENWFKTHR